MSTSAYSRAQAREAKVWIPFTTAIGFSDSQEAERATIFGLYANAYINGKEYLNKIEEFELALIVDQYNANMAALDAEEQNTVLDIATRRYLDNIDQLVHEGKMDTKAKQIAADDAEMDARFDALEADQKILETYAARVGAKEREVEARIATLQASITQEEITRQLVEKDVSQKELDVARREHELSAKDVQLSEKDIQLSRAEVELARQDARKAELNASIEGKDIQVARNALEESRRDLQVLNLGNDVLRIQLQVVEQAIRKLEAEKEVANMDLQGARLDQDIAKTAQIEVDLARAGVRKSQAQVELSGMDLDILETKAETARTEARRSELALSRVRTDEEIARTKKDIAQIQAKIQETDILEADYFKARSRYSAKRAELSKYDAQESIEAEQQARLKNNIDAAGKIQEGEAEIKNKTLEQMAADFNLKKTRLENNAEETKMRYDHRKRGAIQDKNFAETEQTKQSNLTQAKIDTQDEYKDVASDHRDAAVDAATEIANAKISSTLTHYIGKA